MNDEIFGWIWQIFIIGIVYSIVLEINTNNLVVDGGNFAALYYAINIKHDMAFICLLKLCGH